MDQQDSQSLWYKISGERAIISIKVIAHARQSKIEGVRGAELRLRVKAPALEGRANQELVELLSQTIGIPQREIIIVSGEKSPHKKISILSSALANLITALRLR